MSTADPVDLQLATALRDARHRAQLSQTVASVRAGRSLATLRRAELYGAASAATLAALARVYGVTIDDLRARRDAVEAIAGAVQLQTPRGRS